MVRPATVPSETAAAIAAALVFEKITVCSEFMIAELYVKKGVAAIW